MLRLLVWHALPSAISFRQLARPGKLAFRCTGVAAVAQVPPMCSSRMDSAVNTPWLEFSCVTSLATLRSASRCYKACVQAQLVRGLAVACAVKAAAEEPCRLAVRAIGAIAGPDDEVAVQAVREVVRHRDPHVRKAGLEALSKLSRRGDAAAVAAALAALTDDFPDVRRKAVHCLSSLAAREDRASMSAVAALLAHPELPMRKTALYAMQHLDVKGDPGVAEAIVALFDHPKVFARHAALDAIKYVLDRGDRAVVAKLVARLEDNSSHVRASMVAALGVLADIGDKDAIAAIGKCLKDGDPHVRQAALLALGGLAEDGDSAAAGVVMASPELGHLAVGALARLMREVHVSRRASTWAAIDGGRSPWQPASSDLSFSIQRPFARCGAAVAGALAPN